MLQKVEKCIFSRERNNVHFLCVMHFETPNKIRTYHSISFSTTLIKKLIGRNVFICILYDTKKNQRYATILSH